MLNPLWSAFTTLLAASASNHQDGETIGSVTGLYRHAVKGLSADPLDKVVIAQEGETFPDDRRFGLLMKNKKNFDEKEPEWLHKENFLCAFTAPQLMAKYQTSYQIKCDKSTDFSFALPCDDISEISDKTDRATNGLLTVQDRESKEVLLGPISLRSPEGRDELASFFSKVSGKDLVCVSSSTQNHDHQFGNTSSGVKARGDTRTVHLINENTIADVSKAIGHRLNPTRFRPNIVIKGPDPWSEFDWIGKKIQCGDLELDVISRTVRCDGVSVDPLEPKHVLDIPKLLTKNFPEHGPFLGVYAIISRPGTLEVGDPISMLN